MEILDSERKIFLYLKAAVIRLILMSAFFYFLGLGASGVGAFIVAGVLCKCAALISTIVSTPPLICAGDKETLNAAVGGNGSGADRKIVGIRDHYAGSCFSISGKCSATSIYI